MATTSLTTIKNWFITGKKPTQSQFWAWMDSFWHKDEVISQSDIEGLEDVLESLKVREIKPITGLNYTATATDINKKLQFKNVAPQKFYIADDFPNCAFECVQYGEGNVSILAAPGSGVNIICAVSEEAVSAERYSVFAVEWQEEKTYLVHGKLAVSTAFNSTWKTDNISSGSSTAVQVTLPLESTGTYDFIVHWGDGTKNRITAYNQAEITHTYEVAGTYNVSITGRLNGWKFGGLGDRLKLISVEEWGCLKIGNSTGYFHGCSNLNLENVQDVLNLKGTTDLAGAFYDCSALTTVNYMNDWDVSNITDINSCFVNCINFNQDISNWNTVNILDMTLMFFNCQKFNQPIGDWDVANVTNMQQMLNQCYEFNQPLNDWDTSNVTNMAQMFGRSVAFNQPLSNWNVAKVTTMLNMFRGAVDTVTGILTHDMSFNQNIDMWNVGAVTNMAYMFAYNSNFNQPLNSWNISNVTTLNATFKDCRAFNQPLGDWNTANVTNMIQMFASSLTNAKMAFSQDLAWNTAKVISMQQMFMNSLFNGNITGWNTGNVTNMWQMFAFANVFNQNIGGWNVSKVTTFLQMFQNAAAFNGNIVTWNTIAATNMQAMFEGALAFNQAIGVWNTSNVTNVSYMFNLATAFNQSLAGWNVTKLSTLAGFMDNKTYTNYSTANYNATLNSWAAQNVLTGRTVSFGTIRYTSAGQASRNTLTGTKGWTIVDGGLTT
ncbi:BspA family leucine-rich repeat surface protein [Flavobacterium akiainvivens]|uniref:BspA family leucine-rich repeat surface protein n=1 Tax=Flavobacterium akiainvivens TaxID=1202724 RepID=UPI0006C87CBF|nr:BspA family leucine-rich repeat surface protein [Flavobacterium akiainvivens]SFQ66224.1 surface protein [Flavobacterium akiainvivens]